VQVAHGRVEVRPDGAPPTLLETGAAWHARALAVIAPAPTPAPPAAPPAAVANALTAAPLAPRERPTRIAKPAPAANRATAGQRLSSPTTTRGRRCARTASTTRPPDSRARSRSHRTARSPTTPGSGTAVALAREPRAADAIVAFRELLDEHAGSVHHGEAAAMLGWLLVDAKQLAEARTRFEAAGGDPSDDVRASARAGLAALPATTARP